MITQVAPVRKNEGETICSLNFAQRVRNVELGAATRRLENGDMTEVCNPCCKSHKFLFFLQSSISLIKYICAAEF